MDATKPCPISPSTLGNGAICLIDVSFDRDYLRVLLNNAQITITDDNGGTAGSKQTVSLTGGGGDAAVDRGDAGESVDRQGATQQFTATGTFSDSTTQNLTSQVTWASATPRWRRSPRAGLATGVATGTSTITATSGSISGSTVLTVTAATLQSIAVTPANPSIAKGADAAVHGDRDVSATARRRT